MKQQLIRLVTFDATNTILKFRVPPWVHYKNVANDYGFDTNEDQIKQRLKESFKIMYKTHPNFGKDSIQWQEWWKMVVLKTFDGLVPATADIDSIASQLIDDFKTTKCWQISDGSLELISALQHKGVCVGVISNFDPRLAIVLKNLQLLDCFKFVVTSYDIGFSKPDKRIFDYAIKKSTLKVKPHECVHIGDDIDADYYGATGAGWRALLVSKSPAAKPPLPQHVFSSLNKLCVALKSDLL